MLASPRRNAPILAPPIANISTKTRVTCTKTGRSTLAMDMGGSTPRLAGPEQDMANSRLQAPEESSNVKAGPHSLPTLGIQTPGPRLRVARSYYPPPTRLQ